MEINIYREIIAAASNVLGSWQTNFDSSSGSVFELFDDEFPDKNSIAIYIESIIKINLKNFFIF